MPEKIKRPRLMVLNEPDGRRFSKALAMEIGRDHAEVFLQIEYLISISTMPTQNGKLWTKDSIARLQDLHFPYWGKTFIADILKDLSEGYEHTRYTYTGEGRTRKRVSQKVHIDPLLDRGWFNWGGDTTTWYSLNTNGIAKLSSVRMDIEAVTVAVSRKRVGRNAETGFRENDNQLPAEREPVATHAGDFHTEIPTETPTVVVVPEFSPEKQLTDMEPPSTTATFLGERKEIEITHPIMATRIYQAESRAAVAERIYLLVRPNQVTIPAKDKAGKSQAEAVLLAYLDRYGNDEQAAIALRAYALAWDEKYKQSSKTNLTWLTSWAAAESMPQIQKPAKSAVVISDAMYCDTGRPLFNATLDETSPEFSKNYRAWMSHQSGCEQCQGKKKSAPVSTAPRSNPLKAMQSLSERKSL